VDIGVMEEAAQISMNVKMQRILVTRTHCVQTLLEVMCVAASGVLMVMAGHA